MPPDDPRQKVILDAVEAIRNSPKVMTSEEIARAILAALYDATPSVPAAGTVRVRAAVAMDEIDGVISYSVHGETGMTDEGMQAAAQQGLSYEPTPAWFTFITADIPLPVIPEIAAVVEKPDAT